MGIALVGEGYSRARTAIRTGNAKIDDGECTCPKRKDKLVAKRNPKQEPNTLAFDVLWGSGIW